jgi:hypothetical protein
LAGYAIQLFKSLFSEFSFCHHKLGVVNPSGLMVLLVMTVSSGWFSIASSKGASEGEGTEAVSATEDETGKSKIVLRLIVSCKNSDVGKFVSLRLNINMYHFRFTIDFSRLDDVCGFGEE